MARRQWFDVPATTSPLSASLLNDLEARKPEIGLMVINVKEEPFNAKGDGVTDDTAAIMAAKTALGSLGGTIYFPRGNYLFTTLDFNNTTGIVLKGDGGRTNGNQPSTKLFSATTGSGTLISCNSSHGFHMQDVMVLYTSSSYTGRMITFNQDGANGDAAYATFLRCYIGGAGIRTAAVLLDLEKAIICEFRSCNFFGALCAVQGRQAAASYSNGMRFEGCTFAFNVNEHVIDAGQGWSFHSCTFESHVTGAGAQAGAGAYSYSSSTIKADGLTFNGCWMGDATAAGDWINFNGDGLVVIGNYIGAGNIGVRVGLDNVCASTVITGNVFDQMALGILVHTFSGGEILAPNTYKTVTTGVNPGATLPTVASAGTVTLPNNANIVSVTGTTNITSITASYATREVKLVFAGVLTFTQGSNLKLNSAAGNFVTTANDMIHLVCDGTNWVEVTRSANAT